MTELTEYRDDTCSRESVLHGSYPALVGPSWSRLPAAVQRRFGTPLVPGGVRLYRGTVLATELSLAGRILAQLARLVGGPMPFTHGAVGATLVGVTQVDGFGADGVRAQVWTRSYVRPNAFPQVIQSAKCFAGPTGLEERLGYGLVMQLGVRVEGEPGATELVFASSAYVLRVAGFTLTLPAWLSPGACEVRHRDEGIDPHGNGQFTFTLTITHPLLGRLIRQVARYRELPTQE